MLPSRSDILKVLIVAIVTISLSRGLTYIPLSVSFFASTSVADINQFDIYSDLQHAQGIMPYDNSITVVTLPHGSTRYELAQTLMMLSECKPAAIAVDIDLVGEKDPEIDDMLREAIMANKNVVFPCKIDCLDDTSRFFTDAASLGITRGYTNLDTRNRDNAVIRSFTSFYVDTLTHDTIFSLPLQAVRLVYPEAIETLKSHKSSREYINFMVEYLTISYEEIPDWSDAITGSIVLLGLDTQADVHRTSISEQTLGLKIHAYTASTVIREAYIKEVAKWATEVFGFIMIALFISLNIFYGRRFPRAGGFLVRTTTYTLFFSLLISSFVLFMERAVYSDCGWFLLAIAFCPWAIDIYTLLQILADKIKQLAKRVPGALSAAQKWINQKKKQKS